jgi:hypothetical protein
MRNAHFTGRRLTPLWRGRRRHHVLAGVGITVSPARRWPVIDIGEEDHRTLAVAVLIGRAMAGRLGLARLAHL